MILLRQIEMEILGLEHIFCHHLLISLVDLAKNSNSKMRLFDKEIYAYVKYDIKNKYLNLFLFIISLILK